MNTKLASAIALIGLAALMHGSLTLAASAGPVERREVRNPVRESDEGVRGRTIRWRWVDGVRHTSDEADGEFTHEHTFHEDGRVTWRVLSGPAQGHSGTEREYTAVRVADGVYAVSYFAASGHTLTVVLNFHEWRMVGFASGAEVWRQGSGRFALVE